jgi:hypothetical protein
MPDENPVAAHRWRFYRCGGFDQVVIATGDDLRHLSGLDPKLWTALSCPTLGLEFDSHTLALIDADGDGQIRVPEILAAVRWACDMVKDPQVMFEDGGLPLDAFDHSRADGARLRAAAARILAYVGKGPDEGLAVDDFADMTRLFAPAHFNGDGVVPGDVAPDEATAKIIGEIIATQGSVSDRSGEPGITAETASAFFTEAENVLAWRRRALEAADQVMPLGEATSRAAKALESVEAKVEDFFMRCRLAAFDPRAAEALNPPVTAYSALGLQITPVDAEVEALPLAEVAPGRALPLSRGLNPAWMQRMAGLREAIGDRDSLSQEEWIEFSGRFAAHRAWAAERPETAVHEFDSEYLEGLLADGTRERLLALVEQDLAAETSAANIDDVERLVRYQRDLVQLLRNFVTLSDFYGKARKAIFQAGTLYIDGRSCELVLRVSDMAKHASLAPFSGCFLVYCECMRPESGPITIAAALTGGEVDELMVPGRNGIFYDRDGRDWRATVVKVVEQPVSLRQAFWSPYRRMGAFIGDQIRKFAASRDKDIESKAQGNIAGAADGGAAVVPPPFDIAKFAGIFAAMGLAVGAIGTALAAAIAGLFTLAWWQLPLVLLAILLVVSGPSVLLAFMTLRRRNLGPLLDANGWAVNARARINVPFGDSLTGIPKLPAGATRSLNDPFAEKKRPWKVLLLFALLLAGAAVLWRRGYLAGVLGS